MTYTTSSHNIDKRKQRDEDEILPNFLLIHFGEPNMRWLVSSLLFLLLFPATLSAQKKTATVREFKKSWTTYPYSDPNPIPAMSRIYPYYRFDHYTDKPVQMEWKVVELENDYIKVVILPEIGGKIWTAIEKSTGRPFIYNNQVIKFRDIAMRGPWTSGGIEANYGIIGHTPNCATPVDYLTRTNPDGSVSCIIGVLDLLTRTPWRLEIRLAQDEAFFTTSSSWFNATSLEQPYYTWMNVGIKARGNLQFIFPGTNALGHGGETSPWPIQMDTGRDLSYYEQNNFGGYKSYHVFGQYTEFYGGYWHDDDFGMARYSPRDDKPGKKIWIWGLSPQGMIWEKLLTDQDGQYVEVQSGRLFNQAAEQSSNTPFKHRGFAPYSTDVWTEYWFPVKETKGMVTANNYGALNLKIESGVWKLYFSPVQPIDDLLEVFQGDRLIYSNHLRLRPLETFSAAINAAGSNPRLRVRLGGTKLTYQTDSEAGVLSRPQQMPSDFEWSSVYGLWLKGKEHLYQRQYREARKLLEECLKKDPNYGPALVDLAQIEYRSMHYEQAVALSRRALSIDTYNSEANFYYGLSNLALGRPVDAKDGFELATQSTEYRSASFTELSKIHFREKNLPRARDYANKAIDFNRYNLEALQILALIDRSEGKKASASETLARLLAVDPLNHFARMENSLWEKTADSRAAVTSLVRNEMPQETFLELAIWYSSLGLWRDSLQVLDLAPAHPEVSYWKAYLRDKLNEPGVDTALEQAQKLSPRFVFPFRPETAVVLKWTLGRDESWQPRYYLALIEWNCGNDNAAWELLTACGRKPDFAPFYAWRALFAKQIKGVLAPLDDAIQAAEQDDSDWRSINLLVEIYSDKRNDRLELAYLLAKRYYRPASEVYQLGVSYARTLLLTGRFKEAGDLLSNIVILPFEGSTEGRNLYKEAELMQAVERMRAGDWARARVLITAARQWPENLGAGKPYPEDVDERLEDWLESICAGNMNALSESRSLLAKVAAKAGLQYSPNTVLSALALKQLGQSTTADSLIAGWKGSAEQQQWAKDIYQGRPGAELTLEDVNSRVLRAWLAR